MTDLKREIMDGEQADQLLTNPVYQKSIAKVREGLIHAMQNSPMGDESTHNRLVIALQLLGQIEKGIKDMAMTGQMARIQVAESAGQKIRRAILS